MKSLKIIFAGTPEFAAIALKALLASVHQVIAVYTQPDRARGRGLKESPSAVKSLALAQNLPLFQPATLKTREAQESLANLHADVMVVAAYGMLLPKAILTIPPLGCINIHPSLLPRWRGAAPIQRTIFAGDEESGVTIMQMDEGLDTGPILLQKPYTLAATETSQTLHDQLAKLGAAALLEVLNQLAAPGITPRPQDSSQATYATKISKAEALLDWSLPALQLEHRIRAFNPWPVAYTHFQEQILRVWNAKAILEHTSFAPGSIIAASHAGVDVATSHGILRLLAMQLPGGKILSATDFYNARRDILHSGIKLQ